MYIYTVALVYFASADSVNHRWYTVSTNTRSKYATWPPVDFGMWGRSWIQSSADTEGQLYAYERAF